MARAIRLSREDSKETSGPRLAKSVGQADQASEDHVKRPREANLSLHSVPHRVSPTTSNSEVHLAGTAKNSSRAGVRAALPATEKMDVQLPAVIASFCRSSGLTRTEAALAGTILKGKSIDEATRGLGISPRVARMHLKRISMKVDIDPRNRVVV